MRHGSANRRPRNGRGNGSHSGGGQQNRGGSNRAQVFDSNGPDVRIRGTAYQITEKYLALAKDSASAGDRIMMENYLQHAEHYQRIINSWHEEDAYTESDDAGASDGFEMYPRRRPQQQQQQQQQQGQQGQPQPQAGRQPQGGDRPQQHQRGGNSHGQRERQPVVAHEDDLGLPASILGGVSQKVDPAQAPQPVLQDA